MTDPVAVETLLPRNATAAERAMEGASAARVEGLAVPGADLWNPADCPETALPWLAWALSVDRWDPAWPTDVKRLVVADSVAQHRRKGTLAAVRRALDDVGAVYEITENPKGARFTIHVDVFNSASLLSGTLAQVRAQIDEAKRLSVHATVTATAGLRGTIGVRGGAAAVSVAAFEGAA